MAIENGERVVRQVNYREEPTHDQGRMFEEWNARCLEMLITRDNTGESIRKLKVRKAHYERSNSIR